MSFEDMIRAIIREELEPLRMEVQALRTEVELAKKHRGRMYLTAEQVAVRLAVKKSAIYEWAKYDPSFPEPYRFGSLMRFEVSDLERWEDERRVRKGVTA